MNKRPLSVTLISWLFIIVSAAGLLYHAKEINLHDPFEMDLVLGFSTSLLAIIGGALALRGAAWARWLLLAWISYHVYLSIHHSVPQLIIHSALLVAVVYCLFNKKAPAYFRHVADEAA